MIGPNSTHIGRWERNPARRRRKGASIVAVNPRDQAKILEYVAAANAAGAAKHALETTMQQLKAALVEAEQVLKNPALPTSQKVPALQGLVATFQEKARNLETLYLAVPEGERYALLSPGSLLSRPS